jgi:deazaflavin-dependent oxidoreductase (nitroreductase family)
MMTDPNKDNMNVLRFAFKRFNPFMIGLFRLGLGWGVNIWPIVGGRIMVITHTGRKSGLRRRTPVNYAMIDGDLYCTAGFGVVSDWYRNILADPSVGVWLPRSGWRGVAEDISHDPRRISLLREVIIASGVVGPLMGVNPHKMTDAEFDRSTSAYRLVRIRPEQRLSGPDAPGDLTWVWAPAALVVALFIFLFRMRRRAAG